MKVKIKPITRPRWHGYKDENSFSRPVKIFPVVDFETRKYKTGLSPKDINDLKKMGVPYNLDDTYNRYDSHEFWDSPEIKVKLENNTIILDTENALDFIKYKYILQHPSVANSLAEYEEGKYPNATHYIVNSPNESRKKAKTLQVKKKAFDLLNEATRDEKIRAILILEGKDMLKNSESEIDAMILDIIDKTPSDLVSVLSRDKDDVSAEYLVLKALKMRILQKEQFAIKYMDLKLGSTVEAAVEFLKDPNNSDLKAKLEELIKS